jgi:hypothetical protein
MANPFTFEDTQAKNVDLHRALASHTVFSAFRALTARFSPHLRLSSRRSPLTRNGVPTAALISLIDNMLPQKPGNSTLNGLLPKSLWGNQAAAIKAHTGKRWKRRLRAQSKIFPLPILSEA